MKASALAKRGFKICGRVFPRCGMISQAIAFNVFLAFFPTLLIVVGFATSPLGRRTVLFGLMGRITQLLPPNSHSVVSQFLVNRGPEAWKWALFVGSAGTLLFGAQAMKLLMEGIHVIYGDNERPGFWQRQLRGLVLLLLTIAPLAAAAILGIFGRPLRHWMATFGHAGATAFSLVLFPVAVILMAMFALSVIYRVARPAEHGLRRVLPGAMLATLLWWATDGAFGFYVRRVPYVAVYGGLAAVIGLMIWMQISTVIFFLGAAWNAEAEATVRKSQVGILERELGLRV